MGISGSALPCLARHGEAHEGNHAQENNTSRHQWLSFLGGVASLTLFRSSGEGTETDTP